MEGASFPATDATRDYVLEYYQNWSKTYDQDLCPASNWPCIPNLVSAFTKVVGVENKDVRILDVGAGTGMLALELQKFGFTNIDALDASEPMLEKAREKNLYKKYICEFVTGGQKLDIPTGSYDGIISCGTITSGHVKADAFDEFLRLVKQGGHFCFTIRKDVYEQDELGNYAKKFQSLVDSGKWQLLHEEVSDYCLTLLEKQKKCVILCYKVLKNE